MANEKGIFLALLTAIISGISVFVNGFAVQGTDPFIFTTLKNVSVALLIGSLFLLFGWRKELATLSRRQWLTLAAVGAVGGSVPFLLFFWGLSLSSGAIGSFVYRLLFLFAAGIAVFALREKINRTFVIGGILALAGNVLLLKGNLGFGFGELLVLLATVLWAVEFNISKALMKEVSPNAVAFGRMFFGSLIMLAFLAFTGKLWAVSSLGGDSLLWIGITSAFLLAYVLAWYPALRELPVSVATPVLALGGPITALLSLAFLGKAVAPLEAAGMLLVILGVALIAKLPEYFANLLRMPVRN
jgi:drug/metabolite transporter (DMT)-like permease